MALGAVFNISKWSEVIKPLDAGVASSRYADWRSKLRLVISKTEHFTEYAAGSSEDRHELFNTMLDDFIQDFSARVVWENVPLNAYRLTALDTYFQNDIMVQKNREAALAICQLPSMSLLHYVSFKYYEVKKAFGDTKSEPEIIREILKPGKINVEDRGKIGYANIVSIQELLRMATEITATNEFSITKGKVAALEEVAFLDKKGKADVNSGNKKSLLANELCNKCKEQPPTPGFKMCKECFTQAKKRFICNYCRKTGHFKKDCPDFLSKRNSDVVSAFGVEESSAYKGSSVDIISNAKAFYTNSWVGGRQVKVLWDSGASISMVKNKVLSIEEREVSRRVVFANN